MARPPSVESHLIKILAGIAAVAILGVLVLVPYRLYARDIRHAEVQAHRVATVAHTALSSAVARGEDVTDLANRFQGIADFEIRLRKQEAGELDPAATTGRGTSDLDGTDLTYTAAPIEDASGQVYLATMHFDLSPMKRESVRLIIDLILAVVLGSALFSAVVYVLIRRSLVEPLKEVTRTIEAIADSELPAAMPEFETREMLALADAVARACRAHGVEI
jgi:methyl-accepting chemotaxis protein